VTGNEWIKPRVKKRMSEKPEDEMFGPLSGVVVLDFSQLAQGPYATQILGDLGAEIIKIEPPKGDWMRHWSMANLYLNGEGASYLCLNRNKRSVAIDLKQQAGVEVAKRLAARADILIENFRPGVMDRLGLGWETLSKINPRLVYCASSGFGHKGPYVKRPGQDLLIQAVSGLGYLSGDANDPPMGLPIGVADFVASQHIVYAVLAALHHRDKTGAGQRVDINLLNSLLAIMIQELTVYLNGGGAPQRSNSQIPNPYLGAPYGFYKTIDGYIAIAMNPLDKVARLIGVEGYEHRSESQVIADRDEVRRDFAQGFAKKTTQEWLDLLLKEDIWCAQVNTFEDAEKDPQIAENEMIVSWDQPNVGTFRTTGIPVKFQATPGKVKRPAPAIGEHTAEILREFGGYTEDEVSSLEKQRAVCMAEILNKSGSAG
jgi:crotonobetainyl-CoA:carnitine CoA-transferase CaiB-like acyl-CoA transferase